MPEAPHKTSRSKYFSLLFILGSFLLPSIVFAASLFISPSTNSVAVGDNFSILANVNSTGAAINAASSDITFDTNALSVQSVGYSNSIFNLWAEQPTYSNRNGIIHFSGGLPSPGWNGTSGAIIRVTFKAKAIGMTKVDFKNSSVLANDGLGTNVFDSSGGATFTITAATTKTATSTEVAKKKSATSTIPSLLNLPDQLSDGDTLSFDGQGLANSQVLVYIEKGKSNPEIVQENTDENGNFHVTYSKKVSSGYYKIWAVNILPGGVLSPSSDLSYVEVIGKTSTSIFGFAVQYSLVIQIIGFALVIVILFLIILFILYIRLKHKKSNGVGGIKEALRQGLRDIRDGLHKYIKYVFKSGSPKDIEKVESKLEKELDEQLNSMEKEIDDKIDSVGKK